MVTWITVRSFSTRVEADLARGLLEQNGIPCVISADDVGGLRPDLALSSGVLLQVADEDIEDACELLDET